MIDAAGDDPVAGVDAMVAAIGPRLGAPAIHRRDGVLVTGPWLAGVSGVVAALRERLPEQTFAEPSDLAVGDTPVAVVFVVSAAAALTESDCALLDTAAADTDVVIAVVSKIDVHRNWRDTLAADRAILAAHAPRYGHVPWVGTAAVPDIGAPHVGDLVAVVSECLADTDVARRNRLRAWESRLRAVARRYDREIERAGRAARVSALREERRSALHQRRQSKSEGNLALRTQVQQARVQLSYFARNRCASVRTELQEDAGGLHRGGVSGFEDYARGRIDEVVAEVDEGVTAHLADVANVLGLTAGFQPAGRRPQAPEVLPEVSVPVAPLKSRRLETRLMTLLGAGFGLGLALTLSRLLGDLAPGLTAAGIAACVAIGLVVTVWVVSTRALLHDRSVLDRWVGESTGSLRSVVEELVVTRVLAAESALSGTLGKQDEAESRRVADRVGEIDSELREHAVAAARATALRDREMPTLQRALDAVRAELGDPQSDGHVAAAESASGPVSGRQTAKPHESDSMNSANSGF